MICLIPTQIWVQTFILEKESKTNGRGHDRDCGHESGHALHDHDCAHDLRGHGHGRDCGRVSGHDLRDRGHDRVLDWLQPFWQNRCGSISHY